VTLLRRGESILRDAREGVFGVTVLGVLKAGTGTGEWPRGAEPVSLLRFRVFGGVSSTNSNISSGSKNGERGTFADVTAAAPACSIAKPSKVPRDGEVRSFWAKLVLTPFARRFIKY
jgi:hypothetical protein